MICVAVAQQVQDPELIHVKARDCWNGEQVPVVPPPAVRKHSPGVRSIDQLPPLQVSVIPMSGVQPVDAVPDQTVPPLFVRTAVSPSTLAHDPEVTVIVA